MSIEKLPLEYTYLINEAHDNILKFRIKEVTDEVSAKKWIEKMCESSNIVWRIARTYPAAGRVNVFRIHLRCQHATDRRARGVRTSKNTDCPANLNLTVKRFVKHSKSKKIDPLIEEWPTICTLNNDHNHSLEYFMYGYLSNEPEKNYQMKRMLEEINEEFSCVAPPEKHLLNEDEMNEFEVLIQRMIDGYKNEPHIFAPAFKKMLKNSKKYASTKIGLVSAMKNFGLPSTFTKKIGQQNNKSKQIGIRRRAIAKTKLLLPGKKKLVGSPVTVYLVNPNSNISKLKKLHQK